MTENEYGTATIQNYLKNALKVFHDFCVENGIRYSLWDGSMIGAVRHKGFIPWDDDVDIIFDRKNYNKFLKACSQKQHEFRITKRLWIRRVEFDNNIWASMDGGVIDMLVFDNIPDSEFQYRIKVLLLKLLQGMMKDLKKIDIHRFSLFYRPLVIITALLGVPFSDAQKFRWYDRLSKWGNGRKTEYKGVFNEPFAYVGKIRYPNYNDKCLMMPFEDIQAMVYEKYDEYLTLTFGDYMTPPPQKERAAQHIVVE